ncbi:hypothetical protein [Methanobrevibacter sp. UBA188]|uniref:hypothetical protein n=2 Tax=Methanobrevibacter TaxID=2172 RepID=UPI0025EF7F48|nr:hypothetical protein [Methanobrevibacter sp. UBA188]
MDSMKKLYALLIILIVIYVGINVGANGLNILNSNDNTTTTVDAGNKDVKLGDSSFSKIGNFTDSKVNDTAIRLVDNRTGVSILVEQIDSSLNLNDTYNSLISQGTYSSNQEINQNGVPAYFLYKESGEGYDSDIYFAKNNQNYKISGTNVTYDNSEYFINSCKNIIDTIGGSSSNDGKISRW